MISGVPLATVPVNDSASMAPGVCALMEAANAPSAARVALPLAVKKSTGPNGVWKEPLAFRTSPTSVSVLIGVPLAENDPEGPNGVCSLREAENPPSAEVVALPLAVNQLTVPSGVRKVPVASSPRRNWSRSH